MPGLIRDVVLVDGVRTPFGKAAPTGQFANTRADDLVVACARELLRRHPSLPPAQIDEIAIAASRQSGDQGMNLGRVTALLAGFPASVPGYAVDRMCAGAMTAVTTCAASIASGAIDVALAGGVEHMGRHPLGTGLDPNPRLTAESLWDATALTMGATAEILHDLHPNITRDRVDHYAVRSQEKFRAAVARQQIAQDIVPVSTWHDQHGWQVVDTDELPRPASTVDVLAGLQTPFRVGGHVSAGNSAPVADGATACLLADSASAKQWRVPALMRLVSSAYVGVSPHLMGTGPIPATEKALHQAGLSMSDIGAIEINEAFAVQVLVFLAHFGWADDDPRVNPDGGSIAVGHPLAASGVRLMTQLARHFADHPDVQYGITTMCVGLGMGATLIWENLRAPITVS
ncbi:MAG: thiolase family protein [Actinomycetota bacterium]